MPIDMAPPSSNIQGYQIAPPQSADPLQTLAQLGQLRTQGLERQNMLLQQQETQMNLEQRRAVNDAYAAAFSPKPDGTFALDTDKLTNALATGGHGEAIPGILENYTKYQQSLAGLQETKQKVAVGEADAAGNLAAMVQKAKNDPALFHTLLTDLINRGIISPSHYAPLDQMLQQAQQQDPSGAQARQLVGQFTDQMLAGSPKQQELQNQATTAAARRQAAETAKRKQDIEEPGQRTKAILDQVQALAPKLEAAIKGPGGMDAVNDLLDDAPDEVAGYFANATKPGEFTAAALTPEQKTQAAQAATTEAETHRHNLTDESTARLNASIAAGRLAQEKLINGMKYGPDTAEYWAQQLVENPDSVKELPPEMRTNVGRLFSAQTGLPLPTPASAAAQTQETAARNALDGAAFIQNALKNPEIRANLGPILGRLQNVEQTVGTAANLSPQAEQLAQELRTRMRYFVFQEGKAVLGGRLPEKLMGALEASSPNVKMDPDMLQGALNGATGNAQTVIDNVDRQRFGGKMRTPAQRQGAQPASVTSPSGSVPRKINTKAEFDALPSGTVYIDPKDGKKYRKP